MWARRAWAAAVRAAAPSVAVAVVAATAAAPCSAAAAAAPAGSYATLPTVPRHTRDSSSSGSGGGGGGGARAAKEYVPNPRRWVLSALEGDGAEFKAAVGIDASEARPKLDNMIIFAGSSNPALAEEIAYELHRKLGSAAVERFPDGEISVQVNDHVRGKDVYIVQSTSPPVNENLVELLLMISTMRRASARTITAVVPYYGYKRDVGVAPALTTQLRSQGGLEPAFADAVDAAAATGSLLAAVAPAKAAADGGGGGGGSGGRHDFVARAASTAAFPVSAADVAVMLEAMGVDRVISVDMQPPGQGQIEGFFSSTVPVENVRATAIAVEHFRRAKLSNVVVVAPNESCIQLARDFQSGLTKTTGKDVGLAAIIEAGPSRGADRYLHTPRPKPEHTRLEVVGDVAGHDVIIVDDMIDTGYTLMRRLQVLKDHGARTLVAYATHGLFNGGALGRINKSQLAEVVVTNTVPLRDDVDTRHSHKIAQLSVASVVAAAILRMQTGQSLQSLRVPVFDREAPTSTPRYLGQE